MSIKRIIQLAVKGRMREAYNYSLKLKPSPSTRLLQKMLREALEHEEASS